MIDLLANFVVGNYLNIFIEFSFFSKNVEYVHILRVKSQKSSFYQSTAKKNSNKIIFKSFFLHYYIFL
jgi:hypothetical protein